MTRGVESAAQAQSGQVDLATCSAAYWAVYMRGVEDGLLRGYELHRAEVEAAEDAMWAEAVRRVQLVARAPSFEVLSERRGDRATSAREHVQRMAVAS